MGDGRRAGRDLPAVGPGHRADRAGMGRAAGRAPGRAQLQRAALGRPPRRGDGHREGDPVRAADRRRPRRSTTAGSTRPLARELFIRHALVEGDWQTQHGFFARNPGCWPRRQELEQQGPAARPGRRRRGAVRLLRPADPGRGGLRPALRRLVEEGPGRRRRTCSRSPPADLAGPAASRSGPADYPDRWGELPLSYEFAPGAPDDGVTVDVPLAVLNQVGRRTSAGRCRACGRSWSPR